MLQNHRKALALAVAVLTGSVISFQAQASSYNLEQIYNLALQNDAQLAAAKASMKATMEKAPQAKALLLPNLSVAANTQYNKQNKSLDHADDISNNYNSYSWGATLSQPLFNLSSWFGYSEAKQVYGEAEYQFAYQQQQLILRVSTAYFNVLRTEASLLTAEAEERAVQQQLEQAKERYKVGLTPQTDVLDVQAAFDKATVARIQAKNSVAVSYENLRVITNKIVENIGKLKKSMPVSPPSPTTEKSWVKEAIAKNLSLKAANKSVQAAEENIKVQKSGHAPTVDAFASYNYTSSDDVKGTSTPNSTFLYSGKGDTTVYGLNLSLPIFSGGATSSKVREATYQMEQSQQNFDQLLRQTSSNTRDALKTVASDVDRVEAQEQNIISSTSALKATESGYEVGTRNITDVLDAQQKLYAAQRDYLDARYDYIINTLQLKELAGTLSPTDIQSLNKWITFKKSESAAYFVK